MRKTLARVAPVIVFAAAAHAATLVAPGIQLIQGSFVPGSQPDGNSVVIDAPEGLIVVDTGRHPEHTNAIVEYANSAKKPVAAIINTHWHLDHIGGNLLLRNAFPHVKVYATGAFGEARTGFLANYRKQLADVIPKTADAAARRSYEAEAALIDSGDRLAPDVIIPASRPQVFAGRTLDVHVTSHAVTAADIWLFDPKTRTLIAGDLVTLPATFLDTACPEGWKSVLDEIARIDFEKLIPGHGAPMTRADFERYRIAYSNLLACAAGSSEKRTCIDGWIAGVGPLVAESDRKFTRSLMDYYVDVLRADPAKVARLCGG